MGDMMLSDEFKAHLKARALTPEGKKALNDLAGLIVDAFLNSIPPGEFQELALDTDEGIAVFAEA